MSVEETRMDSLCKGNVVEEEVVHWSVRTKLAENHHASAALHVA